MRHRSEVYLILAVSVFALTGVTALRLLDLDPPDVDPGIGTIEPAVYVDPVVVQSPDDARVWFQSIRMYCNPVEVETRMRWQPAPGGPEGDMYEAACYALAGRTDLARAVIEGMPQERRYQAAGVVFESGHPSADAGDEIAAGPLMELVVEFWPNHYMALYHAGAARFERGDYELAEKYLERFLVEYAPEDGWRSNARAMLATIAKG